MNVFHAWFAVHDCQVTSSRLKNEKNKNYSTTEEEEEEDEKISPLNCVYQFFFAASCTDSVYSLKTLTIAWFEHLCGDDATDIKLMNTHHSADVAMQHNAIWGK